MTRLSEFRQLIDRLDEATTAEHHHTKEADEHRKKAAEYGKEAGTLIGRLRREFKFYPIGLPCPPEPEPEFPPEVVNAPRF